MRAIAAAISALTLVACARTVVPEDPEHLSSDATAVDTVSPPATCRAPGDPLAPQALFEGFGTGCTGVTCSTAPTAPHINAVAIRFACDCAATSNPVLEADFEVTDSDTPIGQLTTVVSIMGCQHPGYTAQGTAFSTSCSVSDPSATFASPWNIVVSDPQGHHVTAYLDGPAACHTERFICHRDPSGQFTYQCAP